MLSPVDRKHARSVFGLKKSVLIRIKIRITHLRADSGPLTQRMQWSEGYPSLNSNTHLLARWQDRAWVAQSASLASERFQTENNGTTDTMRGRVYSNQSTTIVHRSLSS